MDENTVCYTTPSHSRPTIWQYYSDSELSNVEENSHLSTFPDAHIHSAAAVLENSW